MRLKITQVVKGSTAEEEVTQGQFGMRLKTVKGTTAEEEVTQGQFGMRPEFAQKKTFQQQENVKSQHLNPLAETFQPKAEEGEVEEQGGGLGEAIYAPKSKLPNAYRVRQSS